jgi:hypothetical protein
MTVATARRRLEPSRNPRDALRAREVGACRCRAQAHSRSRLRVELQALTLEETQ